MTTQEKLKENENDHNHFRRQSNRPKLGRVCKRSGMGMDILKLALEAGFSKDFSGIYYSCGGAAADSDLTSPLERFFNAAYAAGVAAEKARCAALCSEVAAGKDAEAIEEAILARGKK